MIRGRFAADGRPVIDGVVQFPVVQRLGDELRLQALSFIVDTGADVTLIAADDLEHFEFSDFTSDADKYPLTEATGIGGTLTFRRIPVAFYFEHADGRPVLFETTVDLGRPGADVFTLLGRDVLNRFRLTVD